MKTFFLDLLIGLFISVGIYFLPCADPRFRVNVGRLLDEDVIYLEYLDIDGALDQEITIRENDEFGDVIGYVYKDATKNNYGDITVLVGIKLDGTISNVVIASTGNTPTFVNKIKSKYLVNFVDQDISDVTVDTFTGASYTYGSVVETVELANTYYSMNRGDE